MAILLLGEKRLRTCSSKVFNNGYCTFTNDLIADIMCVGTGRAIPGKNAIWDTLLNDVGMVSKS
jgi:hypothetical protein